MDKKLSLKNKRNYNSKSKKLFSGGMILEVVLMVSIIMMIYPIINRQTSKQKSKLRDILIVKEINTIKYAFEKFLLKYVEDVPLDVCDVDLSVLELTTVCKSGAIFKPEVLKKVYDMGLPQSLGKGTNMLGQQYSVRIRKKKLKGNVDMVEAMVVTTGGDLVEELTIRGIAKELGFSGGYVEDNYIIGLNWGSDPTDWGDIDNEALVSKLNPIQADKSLLVKYKSSNKADNTMLTDILMNNNDITKIKELNTRQGMYLRLLGETVSIDDDIDVQIDNELKVLDRIDYDVVNFNFGFISRNGSLSVSSNEPIEFSKNIETDTLLITGSSLSDTESPAMMNELNVSSKVSTALQRLNVKGLLYLEKLSDTSGTSTVADKNNILNINTLYGKYISNDDKTENATISNNNTKLSDCSTCVLYLGKDGKNTNSKLSSFKNIVVKDLNAALNGVKLGTAPAMDGRPKNPGIVIKYDTTLGEILEALERETRVVNLYMNDFFP